MYKVFHIFDHYHLRHVAYLYLCALFYPNSLFIIHKQHSVEMIKAGNGHLIWLKRLDVAALKKLNQEVSILPVVSSFSKSGIVVG